MSEEVNLAGSLGFGFDTFNNSEVSNNHLSVHFNGSKLTEVDLWGKIDLASNSWHHAQIVVDLQQAKVTVNLTPHGGSPFAAISNMSIPGLTPYEARVAFAARTGALHNNHDLDNINVQFQAVPLPAGIILLGSGLIGLVLVSRKGD